MILFHTSVVYFSKPPMSFDNLPALHNVFFAIINRKTSLICK